MFGFPLAVFSAYILTPLNMRRLRPKPLDNPKILNMLAELSEKAGFKKPPKLLIINTPEANAIAYLSIFGKRIVITKGLLDAYERGEISDDELKGILAHELGHHKNKDCLRSSLVFSFISIFDAIAEIFIMAGMINLGKAASPWMDSEERGYYYLGGLFSMLIGILLKIPAKLAAILAFHHNRMLEYAADSFAARLTSPTVFASALQKIYKINTKLIEKELMTLPFPDRWMIKPKNISFIERLFESHPPLESRVQALLEMAK